MGKQYPVICSVLRDVDPTCHFLTLVIFECLAIDRFFRLSIVLHHGTLFFSPEH
jgi:hypothetical protein